MSLPVIRVRVPATTANLGPGFDCLGLSLNLWNESIFCLEGDSLSIKIEGEHGDRLPLDERNLIIRALRFYFDSTGRPSPKGISLRCMNRVPLGSGMGSSASAVLMGLLAGQALAGDPPSDEKILALAGEMEGHADNAAAALLGGLVIVATGEKGWLTRRVEIPEMNIALVLPAVDLPTRTARAALPLQVSMRDATFNLGRTALVIEAFRQGDLSLLSQVMNDRLHEPFRLALIPGAEAARNAVKRTGVAVALSGAGPSLIAFTKDDPKRLINIMMNSFEVAGVQARGFALKSTLFGSSVAEEAA